MALLPQRRAFLRDAAGAIASLVSAQAVFAAEQEKPVQSEVTEHIVEITDFAFVPAKLEVKSGDTVTWINRDIAPHTATADDGSWDTGLIGQNERGSVVVDSAMLTDYYCQYHPMMKAKLEIHCQG